MLQECIRYNGLLAVVASSLVDTLKALKGLVVMSPSLEGVANSMFDNQVGQHWQSNPSPVPANGHYQGLHDTACGAVGAAGWCCTWLLCGRVSMWVHSLPRLRLRTTS